MNIILEIASSLNGKNKAGDFPLLLIQF